MKYLLIILALVNLSSFNVFAHEEEVNKETNLGENVGICPVMHNSALKQYSYTYKGKTYYFCCPMCIEKFKQNPEEYISRIKEITVISYRYGFKPDTITVRKGDILKIKFTSNDVPHGFYIKEYNINVKVAKGEEKIIEFVADKAGVFTIRCSVYCGTGHHKMQAKLIVKE